MGLPFFVDKRVLIPRPDTETLVEAVLGDLEKAEIPIKILDMATGSGAIGLSLSHYLPKAEVTLVDIDEGALEVARDNAKALNLENRTTFIRSDCFKEIPMDSNFHLIVSNPPYIQMKEMAALMADVISYEPAIALHGGEDGLDFYRIISREGKKRLLSGGKIYFEIGWNQGKDVSDVLAAEGFTGIVVLKDLAGLDRVVRGTYEWK